MKPESLSTSIGPVFLNQDTGQYDTCLGSMPYEVLLEKFEAKPRPTVYGEEAMKLFGEEAVQMESAQLRAARSILDDPELRQTIANACGVPERYIRNPPPDKLNEFLKSIFKCDSE